MHESNNYTFVVNASQADVLDVLLDFEAYPDWQESVFAINVGERDVQGRATTLEMGIDARITKMRFVVRALYDDPNCLRWEYVSGDFKDYCGAYVLVPLDAETTEIRYESSFDVGFFVPKAVMRLLKEQMRKRSIRDLELRLAACQSLERRTES